MSINSIPQFFKRSKSMKFVCGTYSWNQWKRLKQWGQALSWWPCWTKKMHTWGLWIWATQVWWLLDPTAKTCLKQFGGVKRNKLDSTRLISVVLVRNCRITQTYFCIRCKTTISLLWEVTVCLTTFLSPKFWAAWNTKETSKNKLTVLRRNLWSSRKIVRLIVHLLSVLETQGSAIQEERKTTLLWS